MPLYSDGIERGDDYEEPDLHKLMREASLRRLSEQQRMLVSQNRDLRTLLEHGSALKEPVSARARAAAGKR